MIVQDTYLKMLYVLIYKTKDICYFGMVVFETKSSFYALPDSDMFTRYCLLCHIKPQQSYHNHRCMKVNLGVHQCTNHIRWSLMDTSFYLTMWHISMSCNRAIRPRENMQCILWNILYQLGHCTMFLVYFCLMPIYTLH